MCWELEGGGEGDMGGSEVREDSGDRRPRGS